MRLSQTSEYALRAVVHLATVGPDRRLSVGDIAAALDVPRNYLSKILHQLALAGVLHSLRGPNGGFVIARPTGDLSLFDVISPIDPIGDEAHCLLGREKCSDLNPCQAHDHWRDVANRIRRFFRETTVADLIE